MSYTTKIEWTDATWNPITGCSRVSKGCEHCYAETLAAGRLRHHPSRTGLTDDYGRWNGNVRLNRPWLEQPLKWKKPRRIFVCAHSDLFHENVPDKWIDMVFAVMGTAKQHVFQVLTKRPERMRNYIVGGAKERLAEGARPLDITIWYGGWPLKNVWLGTSVEDQESLNVRWPALRETPAAVRWLSIEPLLGGITLDGGVDGPDHLVGTRPDWMVVGGESGPGYRPMAADWARLIRDQCDYAMCAFFMKQMAGKKPIPADLMIRQYPPTEETWTS